MRALLRMVLRLVALVAVVAVLVGVPLLLVAVVGSPIPAVDAWRDAWSARRVDTDFAVSVGSAIFLLLWLWFAATAISEAGRIVRCRRDRVALPTVTAADGPSAWIRGLVRFVAISTVSVNALMGGAHGAAPAVSPAPVPVAVVPTVDTVVDHVVVPGDSYWRIAEEHLADELGREPRPREVLVLTEELVARNAPVLGHRDPTLIVPGEVVVIDAPPPPPAVVAPAPPTSPTTQATPTTPPAPTTSPAPTTPPTSTTAPVSIVPATAAPPMSPPVTAPSFSGPLRPDSSSPLGLAAAVLVAGGALAAVESTRRRRLRASSTPATVAPPTFQQARAELSLRTLDAAERLARVDLALRSIAPELARQGALVLAVTAGVAGDITVLLGGGGTPSDEHWRLDMATGAWRLSGGVDLVELAAAARECPQPCPALVHLGVGSGGDDVFVDLEALGVLSVASPHASEILRTIAASLSLSPFLDAEVMVTGVQLDERLPRLRRIDDAGDSLAAVMAAAAGITLAASERSTFALRVTDHGEAWDPTVLVADHVIEGEALEFVLPGRGVAIVTRDSPGAGFTLRSTADGHVLEPLGLRLRPVGIGDDELASVAALVHEPLPSFGSSDVPVPLESSTEPAPDWSLMVRVLGPVEVVARDGTPVTFDRAKSLELVVWLSQHRERSTRSGARAALWDLDVRDSTFANVVSDARRAMARVVAPPHGEEWIGRTLSDELPLHRCVTTDADLLAHAVANARLLAAHDAVAELRPALARVVGLPFASAPYLWTDAEGHTSALVLLSTGAAIELATRCLELGDIDGVFWGTGQGLKALPGHEELIALRMRAHAARGDLAGVRAEWESYERALAAEPWASNEPAPKLAALRHELLAIEVP